MRMRQRYKVTILASVAVCSDNIHVKLRLHGALSLIGAFGAAAGLSAQPQKPLPPLPADVPASARLYVSVPNAPTQRMAAWRDHDGSLEIVYQRRDPDGCLTQVRSTIVIDVVGVPVWLQHRGDMCRPAQRVNESYTRSGVMGIWRTHLGSGEADAIGKKFYLSAVDLPEERAQLARALLAAGDQLVVLPNGNSRIERVRTLTVKSGSRAETLTLYRLHGPDAEPDVLWLDSHGELFAYRAELIREGWQHIASQLR